LTGSAMQSDVKGIHTELVTRDHAYTSVDIPWQIDEDGAPLFRYLRGGGVSAFGRPSHAVARSRRQTRFLVVFAVLAAVWLALLVF